MFVVCGSGCVGRRTLVKQFTCVSVCNDMSDLHVNIQRHASVELFECPE